jgi:glycosyltransferase involved in cell wall biosynthesis
MILLLHNRYRSAGGEERSVEELEWLIRTHLTEEVEVLTRDSAKANKFQAAVGLVHGGINPEEVANAVRSTKARIVHAHNINPLYGWRALAAARAAGATTILHLHNYRLVCATGICFRDGKDCTSCHGHNTLPGLRHNCRGGSRLEALSYAVGISRSLEKIAKHVDRFIVPSRFILDRLRELGAPLGDRISILPHAQREFASSSQAARGSFALFSGRLTLEKGVEDAVRAAMALGRPLVIAGDGPQRARLEELVAQGDGDVRFVGHVSADALADLRSQAALAIVPSHYQEILPFAAVEAMAAGLPVVAASSGGLIDLVPHEGLYPAGNLELLKVRMESLWGNAKAGEQALQKIRSLSSPAVVASQLAEIYRGGAAALATEPQPAH